MTDLKFLYKNELHLLSIRLSRRTIFIRQLQRDQPHQGRNHRLPAQQKFHRQQTHDSRARSFCSQSLKKWISPLNQLRTYWRRWRQTNRFQFILFLRQGQKRLDWHCEGIIYCKFRRYQCWTTHIVFSTLTLNCKRKMWIRSLIHWTWIETKRSLWKICKIYVSDTWQVQL